MDKKKLEYHRKYNRRRYRKIREDIVNRLGGECSLCGSKDNLEIDHVDPSTKSFDSNKWLTVTNAERDREIKKCQLLCRGCHTEKSITERGLKVAKGTHGTLSSYRYCKCDKCRRVKSDYMKEYMKTHIRKRDRAN